MASLAQVVAVASRDFPLQNVGSARRIVLALTRAGIVTLSQARRCLLDDKASVSLRRHSAWVLGLRSNRWSTSALTTAIATSRRRVIIWTCANAILNAGA